MISIIICVYNGENVIEHAIKSVIKQTFEMLELIIVDDGSTDNTFNICKMYSKIDNRIRIIRQKNSGIGFARHIGIAEAKGEWIAFLDADDWYAENWIEDLYKTTLENNTDIVIGNAYMCYRMDDGSINKYERISMSKNYIFKEREKDFLVANAIAARINFNSGVDVTAKRSIGVVWDKLYKKSFLEVNKIDFEKVNLGEDLFFTSKCFSAASEVVYTNVRGYNYFIGGESLSNRHDYKYVEDNQVIVKYYLDNLNLKSEIIRRAISVSQIRFLKMDIKRYFNYFESHDEALNELEKLLESKTFFMAISFVDDRLDDMSEDEKTIVHLIKNKDYEKILNLAL